MNLRTSVRYLIAAAFLIAGLAETLSVTGLVVQLSPHGRWATGFYTVALSGPLQLIGAALIAAGWKARWALYVLGIYISLACVFGNLPLIFNPQVGAGAIVGLLGNLAVIGGILYWLRGDPRSSARPSEPAPAMAGTAWAFQVRVLVGLAVMASILFWIHSGLSPDVRRTRPAAPVATPASVMQVKLLV